MHSIRNAFSLVELSIVLVILGLLTGGILAGQSLIRAAELRAVGTEYTRYYVASRSFNDKYRAVAGDMTNATAFWGKNTTYCNADAGAAPASGSGTCNGDGDGWTQSSTAVNITKENYQYWNQLALAGLIEGSYTGISGPTTATLAIPGTNVPTSRTGVSWRRSSATALNGTTVTYHIFYNNFLGIGKISPTSGEATDPAYTPEEAWNIDTKLDDGKPAYGTVIARYWNNACAAPDDGTTFSNTNLASSYKLSDRSLQCALYFRNAP